MRPNRVPVATYRLQFHAKFGFPQAVEIIDYLRDLGISDAYASPLFRAGEGSTHGYDVVDHTVVNPEFGGEGGFRQFAQALRDRDMGLLIDVVPNHMGIDDPNNRHWQDVLENGPGSPYASFFDIDWRPPKEELRNKVLLPFLGDQYGKALESQQLQVAYADGALFLKCYDRRFPLTLRSWPRVLELAQQRAVGRLAHDDPHWLELESIIISLRNLPPLAETDPEKVHQRQLEHEVAPRRIATLIEAAPPLAESLAEAIDEFNGRPGDARSFDRLEQLLSEQAYRLCYWRVAADEINYRRFFDVKELAAIRVELPAVFRTVHELVFRYLTEGWVTGLRIDHPDGLLDPERYFASLQDEYCRTAGCETPDFSSGPESHAELPLYVVAEKILGGDEPLPANWAVNGTTGYDFLNLMNGVFVDARQASAMRSLYARFTGQSQRARDVAYESKKTILKVSMSSELYVLARRLDRISEGHRYSRDFTLSSLRTVLMETIACFPVYRTYVRPGNDPVSEEDRRRVMAALRIAKRRNPELSSSLFDFVGSVLLLDHPPHLTEQQRDERREFVLRFQQLSGPVTAKGIEDTAFYRDYPLLSLADVGGDPEGFGVSLETFHRRSRERRAAWPHTMLASSTHDTKRSEDVRARINALSECTDEWDQAIARWQRLNARHKSDVDGVEAPTANEEYLIYQTLVGAWPLDGSDNFGSGGAGDAWRQFAARIRQFMSKAMKEAKTNTSWTNPYDDWEQAVDRFIAAVLDPAESREFLADFQKFHAPLAAAGMRNSLSQVLLKVCSPGMPDFYQGTELWDLSLVDPDNRRPVDFGERRRLLAELQAAAGGDRSRLAADLVANWRDGRIKLYVTFQALNFRRQHEAMFQQGDYLPLTATGPAAEHLLSFARVHQGRAAIAVVPRLVLNLQSVGQTLWDRDAWRETELVLPWASGQWRDAFTGQTTAGDGGKLPVGPLLAKLPVALLEGSAG
jgi:(1->4)-alpha-D-glucan 1-alpha-D-glucosylmutase